MKIIESVREMIRFSAKARKAGKSIGLVPTMGALHNGHMSLVRKSKHLAELTVVSIFVNPTQFVKGEDYNCYPRNIKQDRQKCLKAQVDVLFHPSVADMYSSDHSVFVEETSLSTPLCGVSRPGHFRGVATVVAKLFNIVQPDFAVFGQKDAQQARIIVQMVKNLNFPVKIVLAPTVREPDGLAMSSRNAYLSKEERTRAACLYNALQLAKNLAAEKTRDTTAIQRQMRKLINNGSLPVTIDYIVIVDNNTLQPVTRIHSPALVALAVRIGKTRLIDNIVIDV